MKKIIALCSFLLFVISLNAQNNVLNDIKLALKAGSSKEIARHFNTMIELSIVEKGDSYSRDQAEIIVKDFFKKNPAVDFVYIHKGSSEEGHQYVIGSYGSSNGSKYRIYILVKNFNNKYLIDTLNISKE